MTLVHLMIPHRINDINRKNPIDGEVVHGRVMINADGRILTIRETVAVVRILPTKETIRNCDQDEVDPAAERRRPRADTMIQQVEKMYQRIGTESMNRIDVVKGQDVATIGHLLVNGMIQQVAKIVAGIRPR